MVLAALIGIGLLNSFLAFLSAVSGFVFMIALVLLGLSFLRRPAVEAGKPTPNAMGRDRLQITIQAPVGLLGIRRTK